MVSAASPRENESVRLKTCPFVIKVTRFPGEELRWEKSSLSFTNNAEATKSIVRREYREGFAPPPVI